MCTAALQSMHITGSHRRVGMEGYACPGGGGGLPCCRCIGVTRCCCCC